MVKKGFTVVELLLAVAVLSVLASFAVPKIDAYISSLQRENIETAGVALLKRSFKIKDTLGITDSAFAAGYTSSGQALQADSGGMVQVTIDSQVFNFWVGSPSATLNLSNSTYGTSGQRCFYFSINDESFYPQGTSFRYDSCKYSFPAVK